MDAQSQDLLFVPRSPNQWVPLVLPTLICGASWMMGGVPMVTDVGFLFLTILCAFFVSLEFLRFPRRFGIGGILLYGGVLVWFCHDYFAHWFGQNFADISINFPPVVIARAAFYHCLFILLMIVGLNIKKGKWLPRLILSVPDPGSESFYLVMVLLMQAVGFSAFLFTSGSFFTAVFNAAFGTWTGEGVDWIVGRTGNLNYSWGGYVSQIIQMGQVGGIFALLFAIIISTKIWSKVLCWIIWAFWTLNIYGGGRRGDLAFMVLPAIALLFIKYQARCAVRRKKQSIWAYILAGGLSFFLLFFVQAEGTYRAIGLGSADLSKVDITTNRGNSMFSEGLLAWELIPEHRPFFRNTIYGEGFVRPIPDQIFQLVVGLIPRALWNDKPVDELWEWYNSAITGSSNGRVGTTVSHGLVGYWYFHYGLGGVVEGGLLVGWLMAVTERTLQDSNGRPMGMFLSLGMAVWLFRSYRDFSYVELYALLLGAILLTILIHIFRPMFGRLPPPTALPPPVESGYGASYGV